jgi:hypothetical protein
MFTPTESSTVRKAKQNVGMASKIKRAPASEIFAAQRFDFFAKHIAETPFQACFIESNSAAAPVGLDPVRITPPRRPRYNECRQAV